MALEVWIEDYSNVVNVPLLKKVVVVRENVIHITREVDEINETLEFNFTNAYGSKNSPNGAADNLFMYQVQGHDIDCWVRSAAKVASGTVPTHKDVGFYSGSYPRWLYTADGETETIETNVTPVTWILTETAEERAARIKREKTLAWNETLQTLAMRFHRQLRHIKTIANEEKYIEDEPEFAMPPDKTKEPYASHIRHEDSCTYQAALIGMAKYAVDIYENATHVASFVDSSLTAWASQVEEITGNYRKHKDKAWIALKDHTSAPANAPGGANSDTFWKEAVLDSFPAVFNKLDGVLQALNVSTGVGIDEFIEVVKEEFKKPVLQRYWDTKPYEALWTGFRRGRHLYTTNDNGTAKALVHTVTHSPHSNSEQAQVDAALAQSKANYKELFRRYQVARHWERPTT